ncbi:GUN4 domain-containing protein [Pseudanabaena mucicola]|uniref:GUN4 domain-containing protein n=1 Tax=Pseudanabaena mucicola FACHB-723 TaxID=2692860 RepID=A0ABR7ZUX1_9CYAN|nr:GUN4 domain-containing protein [Pseudanabaena mucicola]MBD2187796.1 GUN4 domain-containing protein [Pseudanabaena mucicola FACHB-723]
MDSEEILIEFVGNDDHANGGSVKTINTTKIKDSIQRIANLVQQLATDDAPSHANGLALDEVEIEIKLTDTGEAILLGDGQSKGAITLRFRRPSVAVAAIEQKAVAASASKSLVSSTGVDYTTLQTLLASGKWQEANQETWNVMCRAAHKNLGSVMTAEEIKQISCDDLRMIDDLWRQYSQGRYGFSAQNQVYMSSILE